MRYLCAFIGWLTGKTNSRCHDCQHLDVENKCYGHKMPDDVLNKTISCGFFSKKD